MSTKQQLARAIEDLPESVGIEEAIARLYRLFKLKQTLSPTAELPSPTSPEGGREQRGPTLDQALGLLATDRPPPSDAEVEALLDERRMHKLG